MLLKGYKTSKDYSRLKELLDNGYEIICLTTYDLRWRNKEPHEPLIVTDICRGKFISYGEYRQNDFYLIDGRGKVYVQYWPNDPKLNSFSFEEACAAENIEFIEPTE